MLVLIDQLFVEAEHRWIRKARGIILLVLIDQLFVEASRPLPGGSWWLKLLVLIDQLFVEAEYCRESAANLVEIAGLN